jgi:hypothetical protein
MKTLVAVCIAAAAVTAAAVAAPPVTVTMTATPTTVAYGQKVAFSGQVSVKKANQQVGIESVACGTTSAKKETTVRTVANGTYSASVAPTIGGTYHATFKAGASGPVAISVKPVLELKRVKRYKKLRKRWVQVKRVALKTATAGTKPTVVSSVSFTSKLRAGTRVRAMLSKAQAGPCYLPATSKSLRA